MSDQPQIEVTPTDQPVVADAPQADTPQADGEQHAGLADGAVVVKPDGQPAINPEGKEERVVYEYDEAGAYVGFHKEVI